MTVPVISPAEVAPPPARVAAIAWHLHHLDHLIPLCELFDAPLITLNAKTAAVARACYPFTSIVELSSDPSFETSPLSDPKVRRALVSFDTFLYSNLLFRKELRK